MKLETLLYIFLSSSLLLLTACNDVETSNDRTSEEENETEEIEKTGDNNSEEDNIFSLGDFEVVNSKTELGTVISGPITIEMLGVSVQEGEMKNILTDELPDGEVTFIRLDFIVTSEEDNLTFDGKHLPIKINSEEEWIEPNLLKSGNLSFGYRGAGEYRAFASYLLDDLNAEEVKNITFQMEAPRDENNERLGEDKSIKIDLSK